MATSQPDISFAIIARDRMSAVMRQLTRSTGLLSSSWRTLVGVVARLNVAMLALSVVGPLVAAALASIITVKTAVNFLSFERAARRTRVQLQLLGFSATQARDQVNTLTSLMDRAAVTSFFASQEAINNIGLGFTELVKQIIPLSEKFAEIISADPATVFNALFDAFAKHDPTKFALLVTGVTDLAIPMEVLDALELGDASPLLKFLQSITSTEVLTGIEKLREDLDRIADLTRPSREALVNLATGIIDILIESLATRLEAAKDQLSNAFLLAFGTAAVLSGQTLGRRLGAGILAGMALLLLTDMVTTAEKVTENPALVAAMAAIGFALGRQIGGSRGGLVGGIVFIIGLELLPGIQDAFFDLRLSQQLQVSAFATGIVIGLATKRGFLQSFALGGIFQTAVSEFFSDKNAAQTTTILGFTAIGALLGFKFGGGFKGALIGSLIGQALGNLLSTPAVDKLVADVGLKLGLFFLDGFLGVFVELPILLGNMFIDAFNTAISGINIGGILGNLIPDIPPIPPIPNPVPGIIAGPIFGPQPPPPPTLPPGSGVTGPIILPSGGFFEHGGIVPGPLGAPVSAIVHGGEGIIPNGSGTFIVQLILDKRVVGEVAIDAINRVARNNAGMVPGSIGS